MKNKLIILISILSLGCNSSKNMSTNQSYYLLKKNNGLQTIVSLIYPYVYASTSKDDIQKVKRKLELEYLRNWPIDSHFDHTEVVCDEEMIEFDKYLIGNFGFSFLAEGFDHSQKELNGEIQYGKLFPSSLTDSELLQIQSKMDKYHFHLFEQEPNGKTIIVLNHQSQLASSEITKLTSFYESKTEAKEFIENLIREQFDLDGTFMTVGYITEDDLTKETMKILGSGTEIRYKSRHEDYGKRFVSEKKLSEIENGMETLMKLFESVNKTPYQIVELK